MQGYVLKADIEHYFDTVDHCILLSIIQRKIKDDKVICLIKKIFSNFTMNMPGKGMPIGNLTSQFFANVYLNELDYCVKHVLKVKYYIRYVDDFVLLHREKETLYKYSKEINNYLEKSLLLRLHPQKSKIIPLKKGITFLGYRIFYHHKCLRKSNLRKFRKKFEENLSLCENEIISDQELLASVRGWFGYSLWANTYTLRKEGMKQVKGVVNEDALAQFKLSY